jgi:tetratricopeptide (TPR) repeat protein
MKKRVLVSALVALLLLSVLLACSTVEIPLTAVELLGLGEKYLLELNYEQALVQFLKVIEIEPMDPRGYTGAAEAYIGLGQPDSAAEILRQGLAIVEPDDAGDITKVLEILADSETEDDIGIKRELEELLALYELNEHENILDRIRTDAFQDILAQIDVFPFILLNDTGNYGIGVYEGGFLYIGGYADEQRDGQGFWLQLHNGGRFEGRWQNDLPNGSGNAIFEEGFSDSTPTIWECSGTLIDGLWHGLVEKTATGEFGIGTFVVEYMNGVAVLLDVSSVVDGVTYWNASQNGNTYEMIPESNDRFNGVMPFGRYWR